MTGRVLITGAEGFVGSHLRELLAVRAVAAVADVLDGAALAAAAVQFPLAHPAVSARVPGAVRPEEVDANAALVETVIPADVWAELKREGLLREDAPTP